MWQGVVEDLEHSVANEGSHRAHAPTLWRALFALTAVARLVPLPLRWQVANELVVKVQPDPAIYWKVQNKVPGLRFEVEQARTT